MSESRVEEYISVTEFLKIWPKGLLINLTNCQCKQPYGW